MRHGCCSIQGATMSTLRTWVSLAIWLISGMLLLVIALPTAAPGRAQGSTSPLPVLAYYYIWFDRTSWNRAKSDYPQLGRYSSDDPEIMRQHIQWAKQAGITGFIVSWKSTEKLNQRLRQLIEIADAEQFKLAIIYQGLDFDRDRLPPDRVAADLAFFADQYAGDQAFRLFARPLVIWSGTWEYSRDEIDKVARPLRDRLLVLAAEKNVEGYQRLADVVDGNTYYWSSVDPAQDVGYQEKLNALGKAIHANGGLWIAPAAPGYDSRLLGGRREVARDDGATLRQEMDAALRSSPDAIGLISWNEFSENSHIEPSITHGMRYLEVLADLRGARMPAGADFDSSTPGDTLVRSSNVILLAALLLVIVLSFAVTAWRSSRQS